MTIPNYNIIHYFTNITFYFTKEKIDRNTNFCVNGIKMIAVLWETNRTYQLDITECCLGEYRWSLYAGEKNIVFSGAIIFKYH